ncbi:hypothetical protein [Halocatena pleomorpha]|uniref:Uncharacterized protein n=1 Tax=Halocatena pleomorpha TaxID=1785090 RepID=A0A3P3RDL7_9EURY|nr:hypothetical protein [Halocatena pleomorpha]RRJ31058.1 hypothetical protein EIK79_08605 [Halocatena pleomorpha]
MTIDLTADDLVPANKYLSLSFTELVTDEIETLTVLVNGTPASNAQMYQVNDETSGVLVSVFDMLTNHDMEAGQTMSIEVKGETVSGKSFKGTDNINVIDPTNVLESATDSDVSDIADAANKITDTVDSNGVLGKPSSKMYRQQMY